MLPYIRPATEEEVKPIAEGADLTGSTAVWAWPNEKGVCDLAVLRNCMEIDPVHFFGSQSTQRKMLFFWAACNMLKASGTREVYFNVDAEGSEEYVQFLEKLGASRLNAKPQFRFKLAL
jgi:hypothetical protein